jgi:general secretion pathway protein F
MKFRAKLIKNGVPEAVVVDAVDLDTATGLLRSRGRLLGEVRPANWHQHRASRPSFLPVAEELLILLKGGLSLVECFNVMQRGTGGTNSLYANVLEGHLKSGMSLSDALSAVQFPSLFVALVQAAEQTGDITLAVQRFVTYERRNLELRRKASAALSYPLIIMVVGICVIGFLLLYVVPKFSLVFEDFSGHLSWAVQLMLWWSQAIHGRVTAALTLLIAVIASLSFFLTSLKTKKSVWARLETSPMVSKLFTTFQLANLARTLGVLCDGGIPLTRGLRIAAEQISGSQIRLRIESAALSVVAGQSLSRALATNGIGDEVLSLLIAV